MITLLVKAPDQEIDDQIVKCELDWTVEKLKDHLETVHPNKPKRCEQKIIFSGQVLNDSMILQDIFQQYNQNNETDNTLTVHLVCSMKLTSSQSLENSQPASSTANSSDTPTQSPTAQQYYGQLNNQQIVWMQQAYAHYLIQYMQLMAAQGIQLQTTIPYSQSANLHTITDAASSGNNQLNNNVNRGEDNDERRPGGRDVADPLVIPQNNNNNNGGEDGEFGLNRDWLDVFDLLVRVVAFSSMVYFYSSPPRILIVTFLGFAIYLIQAGFFRGPPMFVNDNNNERIENNHNGGNDAGQQADPVQPRNPPAIDESAHQELRGTNPQEENERPGAWEFTWTFFTSFFASLIPEPPPVI